MCVCVVGMRIVELKSKTRNDYKLSFLQLNVLFSTKNQHTNRFFFIRLYCIRCTESNRRKCSTIDTKSYLWKNDDTSKKRKKENQKKHRKNEVYVNIGTPKCDFAVVAGFVLSSLFRPIETSRHQTHTHTRAIDETHTCV